VPQKIAQSININKAYKFCPLCKGQFSAKDISGDEHTRLVCPDCDYVYYSNPHPTVIAIIEKDDQLLLVKRKNDPHAGFWDLPGGFVESGQTLETALAAELEEEIGAKIKSSQYFASFVSEYPTQYMKRSIVGVVFKVEVISQNFEAKSDTTAVKYFPKNNLPEIAPLQDIQLAIKKLLKEDGLN
jgi:NADH pyrophosphatase NudC (nudix superfamily)